VPAAAVVACAGLRGDAARSAAVRRRDREKVDPRGKKYYWIGGDDLGFVPEEGTDCTATAGGYISVTPLHLDLTNYASLPRIGGDEGGVAMRAAEDRERMVTSQLVARGIDDTRVLRRMRVVPRHAFVARSCGRCVHDSALRSARARPSRKPYIVALMSQACGWSQVSGSSRSARDRAIKPPCWRTSVRRSSRWSGLPAGGCGARAPVGARVLEGLASALRWVRRVAGSCTFCGGSGDGGGARDPSRTGKSASRWWTDDLAGRRCAVPRARGGLADGARFSRGVPRWLPLCEADRSPRMGTIARYGEDFEHLGKDFSGRCIRQQTG